VKRWPSTAPYLWPPYPKPPRNRRFREVHFPPELEAKVTQSATRQSRNPAALVQEVASRHFEEETRSVEAVKPGEEALQQGEYLTREQRSNP
jgi:predicted transcriptional regulator